jgi:hypothetical protein
MVAALTTTTACGKVEDIHDSPEGQQPCVNCHRGAYVTAKNPVHVNVMPETCNTCHNTKAWSPSTVSDHAKWFPLENKHAPLTCTQCHTKGYAKGDTPDTCVGCHKKDYDNAKNPPHLGQSTECKVCHTDKGWRPATFNHPWPLNGKHATASCASCHVGNPPLYKGMPTDCVGCHKQSYDTAATPPHAGFPTTCASCHNEQAWRPSTFLHPWYLDGKHATAACASCHKGTPPVFKGTSKECVTCHLANFNASTYPGHSAFAKTCEDCHGRAGWKPAIGGAHPESKFPLTSGPHSKNGISCTSCHDPARGSSVGGQNTDCIHCHLGEHQRPSIDAKHKGESKYPGANAPVNFCRDCHPQGRN